MSISSAPAAARSSSCYATAVDWGIFISVLLVLLALASGYLGIHLSFHPAISAKAKRGYKIAFVAIGLLTVGLVVWQGVRNTQSQREFQQLVQGARKDTAIVREELQVTHKDFQVETARRQQAEKDFALFVERLSSDTRRGVAEDIRNSPIHVDVSGPKTPENPVVKVSFLDSSKEDSGLFVKRFLATVDRTVTPVSFLVFCTEPIVDANGWITGASMRMGGDSKLSDKSHRFTIDAPAWSASRHMIMTVRSNQENIGVCNFSLQP